MRGIRLKHYCEIDDPPEIPEGAIAPARRKLTEKEIRMCTPEECDECVYLGEGDFACSKKDYVLVVEGFVPTENCLCCKRG